MKQGKTRFWSGFGGNTGDSILVLSNKAIMNGTAPVFCEGNGAVLCFSACFDGF
jgi:hypothetical protein